MIFKVSKKVRIQHCDPGGIVFTPQYFNLFVEVIEDWFSDALDYTFSELITENSAGTPAMRIVARFHRPSRMGDILEFNIQVKRLRRTTALLSLQAICAGEQRCSMDFLYGYSTLDSLSLSPWPSDLLAKMKKYQME
ncbi:MAG: acyl-CoA thioesterase [Leptospiraceae bacterium]|nr:acyl-CoA thioesterase [Leptospiraceae bacterium]